MEKHKEKANVEKNTVVCKTETSVPAVEKDSTKVNTQEVEKVSGEVIDNKRPFIKGFVTDLGDAALSFLKHDLYPW